ncbi:MAG: ABC transporter permease subunit [Streptosporangiales bacterium]|nr:ABC transporter permease subunit [Streptosporangiales bacterium]
MNHSRATSVGCSPGPAGRTRSGCSSRCCAASRCSPSHQGCSPAPTPRSPTCRHGCCRPVRHTKARTTCSAPTSSAATCSAGWSTGPGSRWPSRSPRCSAPACSAAHSASRRRSSAASAARSADMVLSIPFFLLAILTVVVLGPSLVNVVAVLVLVRWPRYARVAFAQTLETRGRDFVRSAVAIGSTPWRVVLRHIVPEVVPSIIVVATLELGLMVIYEASLSFIGLGVQPPDPSWGSMLSDGQEYVSQAWWLATFPGLALFLLVLSVNMLGDFIRDQLDPSERSARM